LTENIAIVVSIIEITFSKCKQYPQDFYIPQTQKNKTPIEMSVLF